MMPSARSSTTRFCVMCVLLSLAIAAATATATAEDKKSCRLCFQLPDSAVLHYKIFSQADQNFHGVDASMNQTAEVDLIMSGKDEQGNTKADIKFKKITSSLVSGGELMDWEPPVKLEGKTLRAFVSRKGVVVDVEALQSIQGIGGERDMRNIVEPWFVRLPDSTLTPGGTWSVNILEGKREDGPPEREGTAVYTFKKIEKKNNIEVAAIEGKITANLNRESPVGMLVGKEKSEVKAYLAIGAGYIVEIKRTTEIKGDVIARDELTNKEKKTETILYSTYEGKLQQD